MFKLKKLELLGFKSFADRTRLEFADGVAAIVGPNGCGKSNLSDAISWVLGEQSARLLRGERMADVIFNGTGMRPPTGMAEVSLTLIDPEYEQAGAEDSNEALQQTLSAEADTTTAQADDAGDNGNGTGSRTTQPLFKPRSGEIVVARRLFRSGESEYLINGEMCRLRDIQDLFMGTGLGPESYAIIEQGRIGQILSSRPSDRRAIIEEAAGVSKFKTRKRLAEAKLESSRQNLARIADILEEVSKQANSLKRQAAKARRYRELREELRGRQKIVLTSRLMALDAECKRLRGELTNARNECSEAAARLEERERDQKAAAARHEELERELSQQREEIAGGDLEKERLQSRLDQIRQQIANLDARAADASSESEQLRAQVSTLEEEAADRARLAGELERDSAAAQNAARQLLATQEALARQVGLTESELEARRHSALAAVSRAADLRNQLVQAQEAGLALERQIARVEAERATVAEEYRRLTSEIEAFLDESRREAKELATLTRSASETAAALDEARAAESHRRSELENLRQEFSRAAARKEALEESLARHAYSTESVRRLLSGNLPTNGHRFHPLGVLADFVEVTPGYEEVVEEFLKRELDCVVVEQHEEARSGIALLGSEGTGRSTFFVTHIPTNGYENGFPNGKVSRERGVIVRLRELVHFGPRLELNGDLTLPALENAYIVDDAATAERLAGAYPECHFLTQGGEHYHHRLVSGGKGPSAGPLALRREFRDLERRTVALESKTHEVEATLADLSARAARLDEDLRVLSSAKLESEKKAVVADEKQRQLREACDRARERLQVFESEAATLDGEHKSVASRQASLRAELETTLAEQSRHEEEVNRTATSLRELRVRLEKLAPELVEAQATASVLTERARAAAAERVRLEAQCNDLRERLGRLAEQMNGWHAEGQQLSQEAEALRERQVQLEASQQAARERWHGVEEECRAVRTRRDELAPLVDAARAELDAHREKRSSAEVSLARAESDHAHHVEQCRKELSAEPAALLAELAPEALLSGETLQAAEAELRELETRLENIGPVNMMALEELEEAEQRFAFLETQRQDLLSSIEDTAQAIREIDQVSRQQFLEAFTAINGYFAESFRTLFGGGIGQMRLTDEADPDCGLDIVAQPPGKRLQNVLLLSGGEKALAALALLIALFRYTPSPFCVLDEVDAPLDESNVDRFTRMIKQMSRHTQFILITHNKRTMEMSQVLYGVTMEEPGVSKLVSVRFEAAEREPVAVPA